MVMSHNGPASKPSFFLPAKAGCVALILCESLCIAYYINITLSRMTASITDLWSFLQFIIYHLSKSCEINQGHIQTVLTWDGPNGALTLGGMKYVSAHTHTTGLQIFSISHIYFNYQHYSILQFLTFL